MCGRTHTYIICNCDCGKRLVTFKYTRLRNSCGCADVKTTPEYLSWRAMKSRCRRDVSYKEGFCSRWDSFENFLADMGSRPPGHTLDRLRRNEPYGPGNAQWATPSEQNENRRTTKRLTVETVTLPLFEGSCTYITYGRTTATLKEFSKLTNIPYTVIYKRVRNGWSADRAITEAYRARRRF